MATWKKLVVSGSGLEQLSNAVTQYITAADVPGAINSFSTASINGVELLADSPSGSFNIVTGSAGTGLTIEGTAGTDTISFGLSAIPNSTLENDGITFGTADVSLGDTVTQLSLTGFTGSFTGSLSDGVTATTQSPGDNSTKVATTAYVDNQVGTATLIISSSDGAGSSIAIDLNDEDLTLTGNDGLEFNLAGNDASIGLTNGGIGAVKLNSNVAGDGLTSTFGVLSLTNNSIKIGDASFTLGNTASLATTGFNSGSFSGSFEGDGSGLTGIASTLTVDADGPTTEDVNLIDDDLQFIGTANEISTTVTKVGNDVTVTISQPDDVTIGQDLTVTRDATISRNLTVLGTASFQHTEDLDVADRFIRLASGSTSAGDGGIVIQQTNALDGEVFGFDSDAGGAGRFGISGSFDASQNTFTPDAFMAAVIEGANEDPNSGTFDTNRYDAKGNIFIQGNAAGTIWIYS